MPTTSEAEEYRMRAENCSQQAEQCSTENEKQQWLSMAKE
jgi:hypothetical protein